MRPRRGHLGLLCSALLSAVVAGRSLAGDHETFDDSEHDAVIRRTDSCNCGPMLAGQNLPDVSSIGIAAWQSPTASTDPYSGSFTSHIGAHLVRIDVVLDGLINPPGPLGLNGLPYDPFQFGNNPLYGFIDFDIDGDKDTGGDFSSGEAAVHYLANVARFGGRPYGSLGARAATGSGDLFESWSHPPQVQLSGADWTLVFCGCFEAVPVYKNNPASPTFCPGSTWIMEGRFFQRTTAYKGASTMTGGSQPGLYDPIVRVRFRHSIDDDHTTVTLVYALDQTGAAQLTGTPPQSYNTSVSDHTSIAEGVSDLIDAAQLSHTPPLDVNSLAYQVTNRWRGKSILSAVDVERWRPTFIVGTAYATPTDGLYIWTDVGFANKRGDLNGDGVVNSLDRAIVASAIEENDGAVTDADGVMDGQVTLPIFGSNFSLYDIDGDGIIGPLDLAYFGTSLCAADFDASGALSVDDIFAFLNAWFSGSLSADFDGSGGLTVQDIFDYLSAWFAGC
jgi:hypothetical protein